MNDEASWTTTDGRLSGEEWVEYGGEVIWAVDFTAGGAPIGLTSKEFRRLNAEWEHRAGWARAKALLAWAFEACSSPVADVEVGRLFVQLYWKK